MKAHHRSKKALAALAGAAALAAGLGVAPAGAQQAGLVNVEISNILNDNEVVANVTVPINAAANICGVSVAVLAANLEGGPVECTARANQNVTVLGFA